MVDIHLDIDYVTFSLEVGPTSKRTYHTSEKFPFLPYLLIGMLLGKSLRVEGVHVILTSRTLTWTPKVWLKRVGDKRENYFLSGDEWR